MEEQKFHKPKISIVIVTWNCADYIRHVISAIAEQTFTDFNILVIDNNSEDDTVEILQNNFGSIVRIVKQKKNVGFSKGYNLGIHWTKGDYVLVMNQDVVLDKNFLRHAKAFLDYEKKIGAVQGKILHWDIVSNKRVDIVDTCGLVIHPSHKIENLFEGKKEKDISTDYNEEDSAIPIFGFSGSCVMFRREALEDVQFEREFFDENFFAYKEDADLSWRMRHRNWDIVYLAKARAWHGRTLKGINNQSDKEVIKHRKTKNARYNMMSYRNHLYMLLKNEYIKNIIYYFVPLMRYEIKKLGYILFFEQKTLLAFKDIVINFQRMRKKRLFIIKNSKMPAKIFQEWVSK